MGYVDAIPNVMARLFPDSRFAAYPMPFHRAAAVKSLVNGQLDSLRALLFKPEIYTWWERLLVGTGLSTNVRRLSAAPPPPPAPHHHLGTTTTTTLPRYTAYRATPPYQVLFPTLVAALLIASLGGGVEVGTALAAKARGEEVGLLLSLLTPTLTLTLTLTLNLTLTRWASCCLCSAPCWLSWGSPSSDMGCCSRQPRSRRNRATPPPPLSPLSPPGACRRHYCPD